jgi:hypothetical protein
MEYLLIILSTNITLYSSYRCMKPSKSSIKSKYIYGKPHKCPESEKLQSSQATVS